MATRMCRWSQVAGSVVLLTTGCKSSLGPAAVTPTWATQSLHKEPDVVMALDVAAMRHDAFFGALLDHFVADVPRSYDALLGASQIDLFATVDRSYIGVVHDAGTPPADVVHCFWPEGSTQVGASTLYQPKRKDAPWLSVVPGAWLFANAPPDEHSPARVHMDDHAVFEAWLGPGAVEDG